MSAERIKALETESQRNHDAWFEALKGQNEAWRCFREYYYAVERALGGDMPAPLRTIHEQNRKNFE